MLTSQYLRDLFSFDFQDFNSPIPWHDAAGISRVRKYTNGYASLFKLGTVSSELANASSRKKLWVSISYGEETDGGIKVSSGNRYTDPIDLDFSDEFYFDMGTHEFFRGEKKTTPQQILDEVNEAHMRPLKPLGGFYLRSRLILWRSILPMIVRVFDVGAILILYVVSGERVKDDVISRLFGSYRDRPEIPLKDIEFEKPQTINFFGYPAKRWSVIFYCLIHLLLLFWLYFAYPAAYQFIRDHSANNFLALLYVPVSFAVSEALLPGLLKSLLRGTPKLYGAIAFRTIKV